MKSKIESKIESVATEILDSIADIAQSMPRGEQLGLLWHLIDQLEDTIYLLWNVFKPQAKDQEPAPGTKEAMLVSLLDSLGAMSNPSELDGRGLPNNERERIEEFIDFYNKRKGQG